MAEYIHDIPDIDASLDPPDMHKLKIFEADPKYFLTLER